MKAQGALAIFIIGQFITVSSFALRMFLMRKLKLVTAQLVATACFGISCIIGFVILCVACWKAVIEINLSKTHQPMEVELIMLQSNYRQVGFLKDLSFPT